MRLNIKALFSLATLVVKTLAQDAEAAAPADSAVVQLTNDNFDDFVASNELFMAEFFAPWCGHCKNLAPHYIEAAEYLSNTEKNISLAQIDCTQNDELCMDHGIRGYPTLKIFKDGKAIDYEGQRSANAIINFMLKHSLPPVQVFNNTNDLLNTLNSTTSPVIVNYGVSDDYNTTFYNVAKQLNMEYTFISLPDDKQKNKLSIYVPIENEKDKTDILNNFERIDFNGDFKKLTTNDTITIDWIKTESVPYFTDLNGDNYKFFFEAGIPLGYLFYNDEDELKNYLPIFTSISKNNRGKMNFVHLDARKYGRFAENLNIKQQFPAFAIQDFNTNLKYGLQQLDDKSFENLKKPNQLIKKDIDSLVNDVLNGKAEPIIKSEEIPTKQDTNVIKIVAKTHEKITTDPTKDVLVKYYADWCGHCKRMAPTYLELADIYASDNKSSDKVLIAEMNGELNDVPSVKIEGFPTIILYPAGKNSEPIEYSGGRDVASFIDFIKENGNNKIDATEAMELLKEEEEKAKAKANEAALDLDQDEDDEDFEDELDLDEL